MKYFKDVVIIFENGKQLKSKIFDTIKTIKHRYAIGSFIYGYGKIKKLQIKTSKELLKNATDLK